MAGMVANAQLALDQLGHSVAGPQLSSEAVRLRPLPQPFQPLPLLLGCHAWLSTRRFAFAQSLGSCALACAAHPLRDRSRGNPSHSGASPAGEAPRPADDAPHATPSPGLTRRCSFFTSCSIPEAL